MGITDAIKDSVMESFNTTLSTTDSILGLLVSLIAGLFILLIYRSVMRQISANRSFCITLMLVCSISAMVVLTITSNLALSLGMVGALSIVRFRTAIKDASDTAFMFWAVAAGITAGAGFYLLTAIGCLFIGVLCLISNIICNFADKPYLLVIKAEAVDAANLVEKALAKSKMSYRLSSLVDNGTGMEVIYELGLKESGKEKLLALKEIPGVVAVSLVDCRKN